MRILIFIGLKLYEIVKWPFLIGGWILGIGIVLGFLGIPGRFFCNFMDRVLDSKNFIIDPFILDLTYTVYLKLIGSGLMTIVWIAFIVIILIVIVVSILHIGLLFFTLWEEREYNWYIFKTKITKIEKWLQDNWKLAGEIEKRWRKK